VILTIASDAYDLPKFKLIFKYFYHTTKDVFWQALEEFLVLAVIKK